MNFKFRVGLLKIARKKWPKVFTEDVCSVMDYWADDKEVVVSAFKIERKVLPDLKHLAKVNGDTSLSQKIGMYLNLVDDVSGKVISQLETLCSALVLYLKATPNKWVFSEADDGRPVPFFVRRIYQKPRSKYSPPCVCMKMEFMDCGAINDRTVTWYPADLGRNLVELLNRAGIYRETANAVLHYKSEIEAFKSVSPLTGSQFVASGYGFQGNGWNEDCVSMERDKKATRVIIDDLSEDPEGDEDDRGNTRHVRLRQVCDEGTSSMDFWEQGCANDDDEDERERENTGKEVCLPVHPYLRCFDLDRHSFVWVHVSNLVPYAYDEGSVNKLVLPSETKSLIKILMHGASMDMEDIVKGKTGGVIVVLTGPPGTGKTLTAEVFSDYVKRPLYVVNCSQLGVDTNEVGNQLRVILDRAQRWNALLLIDEADVYVHERGTDIQQNAVVGTFLQVLERYRGVLFMTSNRSTIIDDAIMSRATAWLRYEFPTSAELVDLWTTLSAQYGVKFSAHDMKVLKERFPIISGRNIKNVLRLSRMFMAETGKPVDAETVCYCSKFLDLSHNEGKKEPPPDTEVWVEKPFKG